MPKWCPSQGIDRQQPVHRWIAKWTRAQPGHFRVDFCLSSKTSLRTKLFNWKWDWFTCKWTYSWNTCSWFCNKTRFGTELGNALMTILIIHKIWCNCHLLWINSVWYTPAVYSDGGIAWLLLPPLYLANEIDQSGTWIWRPNIRPSSVFVLTNHSRCTLLTC